MNFKEWLKLQENMTGSNCVAAFKRISIPMIRRTPIGPWGEKDPFFHRKKKKKKGK